MRDSVYQGSARLTRRDALGLAVCAGVAGGVSALGLGCRSSRSGLAARGGSRAPALPREFRAAWVATVDNIDWPSEPGLSVERQREEIGRILSVASRLRLNAILLQVRPTSDALYPSFTEPWSAFLTGAQGVGPEPSYDPLAEWIAGAHARGIDLHAWINPFRVRHPVSIGADTSSHVSKRRPDLVRSYGPYLWLDPGEPEARQLAMAVVQELLSRYDLDGVHMDDYFYPYPVEGRAFPDDASFARYGRGFTDRDAWRRENINELVRGLNRLTHRARPGALFTVSPFGIWRPGHPAGVVGFDAYASLHADSRLWLAEGWCDALMPQLYWSIDSPGQPFDGLLSWWMSQPSAGRHVWPGLYLTRIKGAGFDGASWEPGEIVDQIGLVRRRVPRPGFALFSMVGMDENRRGVSDRLAEGPLAGDAVAPASPWTGGVTPRAPVEVRVDGSGGAVIVRTHAAHPPARRIAVRAETGSGWVTRLAPGGGGRVVRVELGASPVRSGRGGGVVANVIGPNGRTSRGVVAST